MPVQILVPLRPRQRAEELMPYFEFLTQPGSSVVFLVSINANVFPWWLESLSLPATDGDRGMPLTVLAASVSLERQLQSATRKLADLCRGLEARGVAVRVECYSGGLQKALKRLRNTETQTVVLRSRHRRFLGAWLGLFSFLLPGVERHHRAAMTLSLPHA